MSTDTLPDWFWITYYIFLLLTIGTAAYSLFRKQLFISSMLVIFIAVTVPFISLFYSIGRSYGLNELEHLFRQLSRGEIWSIYAVVGYLYLIFWWILFFRRKKRPPVTSLQ